MKSEFISVLIMSQCGSDKIFSVYHSMPQAGITLPSGIKNVKHTFLKIFLAQQTPDSVKVEFFFNCVLLSAVSSSPRGWHESQSFEV